MVRKTMNASRLQQEVSRRIQRVQEVVDDGVRIDVPRPQLQPADAGGCNWTMKHFGHAAGFEAVIADVLARVRAEYNLADDAGDAPAAKTPNDPFGGSTHERAAVNPFGDEAVTKSRDPFASPTAGREAKASQKKPRDPFAGD